MDEGAMLRAVCVQNQVRDFVFQFGSINLEFLGLGDGIALSALEQLLH
jgi:hypothetical protein